MSWKTQEAPQNKSFKGCPSVDLIWEEKSCSNTLLVMAEVTPENMGTEMILALTREATERTDTLQV